MLSCSYLGLSKNQERLLSLLNLKPPQGPAKGLVLDEKKMCSGPIFWLVHQVKISLTWLHLLFNSSPCS